MTGYQPGVCNIGRRHRRSRLALGTVSLLVGLAYTAWAVATGQPAVAFAGTFVFGAGAVLGAVQYHLSFCVSMAALARYDLAGDGGDAGTIHERSALHTDRWRAAQIVAVSVAGGGILAATAFLASLSVAA